MSHMIGAHVWLFLTWSLSRSSRQHLASTLKRKSSLSEEMMDYSGLTSNWQPGGHEKSDTWMVSTEITRFVVNLLHNNTNRNMTTTLILNIIFKETIRKYPVLKARERICCLTLTF